MTVMDESILRNQALGIASMRAVHSETTEELLAEADKVLAWLKGGETPKTETQSAHESVAAVAGQEPKGE